MSATETATEERPRKALLVPLILSLVMAAAGGTGGLFAVRTGILPLGKAHASAESDGSDISPHGEGAASPEHGEGAASPEIEFVSIDPVVVSIGHGRERMHLRFRAAAHQFAERGQIGAELSYR